MKRQCYKLTVAVVAESPQMCVEGTTAVSRGFEWGYCECVEVILLWNG